MAKKKKKKRQGKEEKNKKQMRCHQEAKRIPKVPFLSKKLFFPLSHL